MLAYKNRFHGHGSLRFVYKNGKAVRSKLLTLKVSENKRRQRPRFAVVISKKVLKGAVGRNRVRRRVYEVIRGCIEDISPAGIDAAIIISSAEIRELPNYELQSLLMELFQEAGIYKITP